MTALSKEAEAQLARWPSRARVLFSELLADAGTALQRELLQRAVAAEHTPNEVHAFADQLRGMADDEAFVACTLDEDAPSDYTVAQLLRAESDPLYAFELKGGTLEPADDEPPLLPVKKSQSVANLRRITASFVADSTDADPATRASQVDLPIVKMPRASGAASTLLFETLLADATRAHGLSWRESELDVPNGMSLDAAVAAGSSVLGDGLPVPMAIGPSPGKSARLIVALQISVSGRTRAWQLFDPFSSELVWANERDLRSATELPFADKFFRRVTRIALPSRRRTAF